MTVINSKRLDKVSKEKLIEEIKNLTAEQWAKLKDCVLKGE